MEGTSEINELDDLLMKVASRRKRYPDLCSKYLSKTMQIEIKHLKSATVDINDSRCNNYINWGIPNKFKEDMTVSLKNLNSLENMKKADDALHKIKSIKRVLDQIQKEKNCEMDMYLKKLCKTCEDT